MIHLIVRFLLILTISLPALVTAGEEYWEYTFRPGDTIWNIAKKYTTTVDNWDEIQRLNDIRQGPDRKIRPGTRIVIPISMLKQQPTPAVVIALSGDVSLLRANGETTKVKLGDKLYSGDRVVTANEQSLRLQFADLSELQVLADTEVVLDKLSHHKETGMVDTRVRLNSGGINTKVEKQLPGSRYEIRTPAAVTAVRGTAFRMSTDEQVSKTEVTGGIVVVSAGETEVTVQDGYGIVAVKDQPLPEPVKLLAAPEVSITPLNEQSAVSLSWPVLQGATSYRYRLASDKNFNQLLLDSTTTENSLLLDQLQPGQYYLQIRGIHQTGLEGLNAVVDFEIKPAPVPVEDDSYWKVIMTIGIVLILL